MKKLTPSEIKQRLADIGEKMKKATGKDLDQLTKEIDIIIGFNESEPDADIDAEWHKRNHDE